MPDDARSVPVPRPPPVKREPLVPNAVLGMAIFVVVELMFFSGVVSAFLITRASTLAILWPPPGQPRLPVEATAINTVILLASGALLPLAARALREQKSRAYPLALASFVGGVTFLSVQGFEWARLIAEGLTMTTSVHGAFFYLVVGIHALHVIGALGGFAWVVWRIKRGTITHAQMSAMQVLWSFVVLVWPALYVMVYLG